MRKNLLIVSFLISLAILLVVAFPSPKKVETPATPKPAPVVKTYPVPPEVLKVSIQLGLDQSIVSQIQYTLGSTGPCTGPGFWGCYRSGQIWLLDVQPYRLAHEYLHYVYQTTPEVRNLNLRPIYDNNPSLRNGMRNYTSVQIDNELFPVICTQVADYKLPADVLATCTKYLPNRSILPSDY